MPLPLAEVLSCPRDSAPPLPCDGLRTEMDGFLDIDDLTCIRNIPARSLAEGPRRLGLREAGDRLFDFMAQRGHRADFVLERPPLAGALGFFGSAKVRASTATGS